VKVVDPKGGNKLLRRRIKHVHLYPIEVSQEQDAQQDQGTF